MLTHFFFHLAEGGLGLQKKYPQTLQQASDCQTRPVNSTILRPPPIVADEFQASLEAIVVGRPGVVKRESMDRR